MLSNENPIDSSLFVTPRSCPRIEECYFYHSMDVPGIGPVVGEWDLRGRFDDYVNHVNLNGKRVLDVGTASGFLTWEAERRGATVVSFDLDHSRRQKLLPFKNSIYCVDREESERQRETFFNALKQSYWLGHHAWKSKANVYYGDIENLPRGLGNFDVAFICSILEHLPDHIQALWSIGALADRLVIVTPLFDTKGRLAQFAGDSGHPEANFSFWRYSIGVYSEVLSMMGFNIASVKNGSFRHVSSRQDIERTTIIADRVG